MRTLLKALLSFTGILILVSIGVAIYKVAQKACWENKVEFVGPPSLDSWDPTERAEAAREAGKKLGGTQ